MCPFLPELARRRVSSVARHGCVVVVVVVVVVVGGEVEVDVEGVAENNVSNDCALPTVDQKSNVGGFTSFLSSRLGASVANLRRRPRRRQQTRNRGDRME